jgi:Ca-activated chloride channel family protein
MSDLHPDSIWNDPRITGYVLGEMSPEEVTEFESEIAANPPLAVAVEEARALTGQLTAHFAGETVDPLQAERRNTIFAQFLATSPDTSQPSDTESAVNNRDVAPRKPWWRRHWIELAVAASIGFIVVSLSIPSVRHEGVAMLRTNSPAVSGRSTQPEFSVASSSDDAIGESLRYPQAAAMSTGDDPMGELTEAAKSPQAEQMSSLAIQASEPQAREKGSRADERPTLSPIRVPSSAPMDAGDPAPAANAMDRMFSQPNTAAPYGPSQAIRNPMGVSAPLPAGAEINRDTISRRGIAGAEADRRRSSPFLEETIDQGRGPGMAGDRFDPITDNPFKRVGEHPLSTFSIDVDTASYSKVRSFLVQSGRLPRPDAVRIEEMINYFDYAYEPPAAGSEHPLVARVEIVSCPWNLDHRLARIAIKGKSFEKDERLACNLVFLIDTSGSMNAPNRLPLVQQGLKLLLESLRPQDRVAIVVYAGSSGLVLDSTPASDDAKIRRALTQLAAGGSTNGGAGIALAYQTARDNFIQDGVNRVILCTDGDFNVGVTGTDSLVRMVEQEAQGGIFLTVLGFGMGNHNDAMLEQISGRGNGNYAYIDTIKEARKVLVKQTDSTLVTIAKDVKLQLEFNPAKVAAYRLIGYENRVLAKEDFNDDKKDAGEIGAGHTVTALYEIVPAGIKADALAPPVDPLKYQQEVRTSEPHISDETLTVKIRYKEPSGDTSKLVEFPVTDRAKTFDQAEEDLRFAAAVAGFGMRLRNSPYAGTWTYQDVEGTARNALGKDVDGLRAEFLELVRLAMQLSAQER